MPSVPLHVRLRLGVAVLFVAALVVVALTVDVPSVSQLRTDFGGTGLAGGLAFAALYAALSLLPLPAAVVTLAAGAVFGPVKGVIIVLVGANLGAAGGFWLARLLGREAITRLTGERVERLDALLGRRGFVAVLAVRLVPVIPFGPLNYLSGLTGVRFGAYAAGTALGIVPGSVVYVLVGAYGNRPGSLPFLVSLGALALLTVAGVIAVRRHRRRGATRVLGADPEAAGPPAAAADG